MPRDTGPPRGYRNKLLLTPSDALAASQNRINDLLSVIPAAKAVVDVAKLSSQYTHLSIICTKLDDLVELSTNSPESYSCILADNPALDFGCTHIEKP
jgi:hypothetical protein